MKSLIVIFLRCYLPIGRDECSETGKKYQIAFITLDLPMSNKRIIQKIITLLPEFSNFKEKYHCETFPEYLPGDNDFEICGKLISDAIITTLQANNQKR